MPVKSDIGSFYKSESYDSHRLDNVSFISRLYRVVRRVNLKLKVRWLQRYARTGTVVDYGCGLGHFVHALKDAGYDALGYEIDDDTRALAKEALNLDLYPLDAFLQHDENSLDAITMWHVLEHVYDLNADFSELVNRLKVGGVMMIAVPNFRSWDAQKYGVAWEAYDVPRHLYHFDATRLIKFAEDFGLNHCETIPLKFDSFYVSMRSEKNLDNGSVFRGVWSGLVSNLKARKHGYSSHVFVFRKM